jgi:DNA-binding helix-hairpin-helix protein with protein kinase domain
VTTLASRSLPDSVLLAGTARSFTLGGEVGRGRSASVHKLREAPSLAVKLFFDVPDDLFELCSLFDRHNLTELAAGEDDGHIAVATPLGVACTHEDSGPVGLFVPLIDKDRFRSLEAFRASKEVHDLRLSTSVSLSLASLVRELHDRGVVIGDLSEKNILVDLSGKVSIIDADSFGFISSSGETERAARNWTTGSAAPGLHRHGSALSQDTDNFALGIHIAFLLFTVHPYGFFRNGYPDDLDLTEQQSIEQGYTWIFSPEDYNVLPEDGPGAAGLPPSVAAAFKDCFFHPDDPTTASEWVAALIEALSAIALCQDDPTHQRFAAAPLCIRGPAGAVLPKQFWSESALRSSASPVTNLARRWSNRNRWIAAIAMFLLLAIVALIAIVATAPSRSASRTWSSNSQSSIARGISVQC